MITRRQVFAAAVCAAVTASCVDDAPLGTRVEPAQSLLLEREPRPGDRELRLRVGLSALGERVDRAVARHDGEQIGVVVWVQARVPAPDEVVPTEGRTVSTTIALDRQVGSAVVVDLLANPPTRIPVAP